jgi:hypothetical protein
MLKTKFVKFSLINQNWMKLCSTYYRVSINDCQVKPALDKNITVPPFWNRCPFNLLSTVTSDMIGVLFALFNPVFVLCIRFITSKLCIFQYKLQILKMFLSFRICRIYSTHKAAHSKLASWTRQSFMDSLYKPMAKNANKKS